MSSWSFNICVKRKHSTALRQRKERLHIWLCMYIVWDTNIDVHTYMYIGTKTNRRSKHTNAQFVKQLNFVSTIGNMERHIWICVCLVVYERNSIRSKYWYERVGSVVHLNGIQIFGILGEYQKYTQLIHMILIALWKVAKGS